MNRSDVKVARIALDEIRFHNHNVRVDLGDLRSLTESVRKFGVMQPIVVENRGDHWRIRAGHRRVAAARLAGLKRIPAVIHSEALDDDEWLVQAAHENTRRRDLDRKDRARAVEAMRAEGMSWAGIADAFGVSIQNARSYVGHPDSDLPEQSALKRKRDEQVAALTREGLSANQISERLGISARTVVRKRSKTHAVAEGSVRSFVHAWRSAIGGGGATADDILLALEGFAESGRLLDHAPAETPRQAS